MTKIVRELLKARRIKVAYVPATYTSVFSPPDQFIQKEIKAGNNKQFSHWYAEQINDQIDSGIPEDEVWVDFTLTNMKPIHARWTIATFEKLRDRKDLMRKAWEVTGLWSVIHGTFTPTPNCPVVYEDPGEENDDPRTILNLSTPQLQRVMKWREQEVIVTLSLTMQYLKWWLICKRRKLRCKLLQREEGEINVLCWNLVMRIAQMVPKDHLPSALNKLLREQGWRRSEYEGRKKK